MPKRSWASEKRFCQTRKRLIIGAMKTKRTSLALGLAALLAVSCSASSGPLSDPYRLKMDFHDGFTILWLTDIHWGWTEDNPDYEKERLHLSGMIEEAKKNQSPDLLVLTGDSFRTATQLQVNELLDIIDSFDIPWAFTYGNHDTESFSAYQYYINDQIVKRKNQVFVDVKNDGLTGLANYYIDLVSEEKAIYRLYIIDSNSYGGTGYDVIHQDQLDHLQSIYRTAGDNAPGLAFFHIPLTEFSSAYQGYQLGMFQGRGSNGEAVSSPYTNNGAYDVFKSINVKACFCGHDHKNFSDVYYKNEMILSFGAKATDLDYHTEGLYGYKIITLPQNPASFSLGNIQMHYFLYQ